LPAAYWRALVNLPRIAPILPHPSGNPLSMYARIVKQISLMLINYWIWLWPKCVCNVLSNAGASCWLSSKLWLFRPMSSGWMPTPYLLALTCR